MGLSGRGSPAQTAKDCSVWTLKGIQLWLAAELDAGSARPGETRRIAPNNRTPLPQRIVRGVIGYVIVLLLAAVLLQVFTLSGPDLAWRADKNVDWRLNAGQWLGWIHGTILKSTATAGSSPTLQ
jgi:hypothetical protein